MTPIGVPWIRAVVGWVLLSSDLESPLAVSHVCRLQNPV